MYIKSGRLLHIFNCHTKTVGFWRNIYAHLWLSRYFYLLTGQSNLICSSEPVVALVGNDVILPCRIEPPIVASSKTVEWTKPGLDPEYIHVHQDGKLIYQSQNPLYNYRTAVFVDQLINGNVSLKIFSVKFSDAGKYKCFLPWLWKNSFIQLNVSKSDISCLGRFKDEHRCCIQN